MPLGENTTLKDKLIKKTTGKVSTAVKESTTNKEGSTSTTYPGYRSDDPARATYMTKKMTFYVKEDLMEKLYNFAYWDRHRLSDAFNRVLADGLKGKNTRTRAKS